MKLVLAISFCIAFLAFLVSSEWDDFKHDFVQDNNFNVSASSASSSAAGNSSINFCHASVCFIDSARMLKWMDSKVDLCRDFYNFTCGSFMKFKPLHERYANQGIERLAANTLDNKIRNFLTDPVRRDDELAVRFARTFFQKCVDRDYIEKTSPAEYLRHLDRFGWGFPLIEGDAWHGRNFSKFKILIEYPALWREFFGYVDVRKGNESEDFDVYIGNFHFYRNLYLKHRNQSDFACRTLHRIFQVSNSTCGNRYDNIEKTDRAYFDKYPADYDIESKFSYSDTPYHEAFELELPDDESTTSVNMTLDELQRFFDEHDVEHFDWKSMISDLLSIDSVSGGQLVKIGYLNTLLKQIRWLTLFDDAEFLNWFYALMFSRYPAIFLIYPEIDEDFKVYFKQTRAVQRHEQCLVLIERYFPYIIPFISAHLTDEPTRRLVTETISQVGEIQRALIRQSSMPNADKIDARLRLDAVLESEYFGSVLPKFELAEATKAFLESIVDGDRLAALHRVMEEGQRFRDGHVKKGDGFVIFRDSLTLTIFPFVHPDRPRYFNDAYFAVKIFNMLRARLDILKDVNVYDKIFEAYEEWEDEHGSDTALPGINFTNKQMFWLAVTHFNCYKAREKQVDVRNSTIYYTESKFYMQQEFGCATQPGFVVNKDHDALEFLSFLKASELEDLGLKIVG